MSMSLNTLSALTNARLKTCVGMIERTGSGFLVTACIYNCQLSDTAEVTTPADATHLHSVCLRINSRIAQSWGRVKGAYKRFAFQ